MLLINKVLIWGIIIFCLWSLLVSLYVFYVHTHPPRYVTRGTPADLGLDYEKVSLVTADGVKLAAWYIPSPRKDAPVIIACHGFPFDKGNILGLVRFLYPDYGIFLFDFRRMGESEGTITTVGYRETKDLAAAVDYLRARGIKKIGALGFSLGGAVLILANNPAIEAVVADSSYADLNSVLDSLFKNLGPLKWPLIKLVDLWVKVFLRVDLGEISPLQQIREIDCPVLLIHGAADSQIPGEHSQRLFIEARASGKNAQFWLVPGSDHGQAHSDYPVEYEQKVKGFFAGVFQLD